MTTLQSTLLKTIVTLLSVGQFIACTTVRHGGQSNATSIKVRPGDAIEVIFAYYPDLNQTVMVDDAGAIHLKGIGEMHVRGRTRTEIETSVKAEYSRQLAQPQVQVRIKRSFNFTVYVGGHIKQPGVVKFKPDMTVAQSIMHAGGLKQGTVYDVYIFRAAGKDGLRRFKLTWNSRATEGLRNKNMKVAPFDIIYVLRSKPPKPRGREI